MPLPAPLKNPAAAIAVSAGRLSEDLLTAALLGPAAGFFDQTSDRVEVPVPKALEPLLQPVADRLGLLDLARLCAVRLWQVAEAFRGPADGRRDAFGDRQRGQRDVFAPERVLDRLARPAFLRHEHLHLNESDRHVPYDAMTVWMMAAPPPVKGSVMASFVRSAVRKSTLARTDDGERTLFRSVGDQVLERESAGIDEDLGRHR